MYVIMSTLSHFWWGGSGNKKGIRWLSWTKCVLIKRKGGGGGGGGLSFRDLQDFNTTMLAITRQTRLFVFKGF